MNSDAIYICNPIYWLPHLWDFEIEMDHLILARQLDLVIVKKKKREPAVMADHIVKLKESEKRDKSQDLAIKLKKL